MLGLKKCTEEEFYKFENHMGYQHRAGDIDESIMKSLVSSSLFLAFGYFVISQFNKELSHLLGILSLVLALVDISVFMIGKIEKKKYLFKFQKSLMVLLMINWMVFPLSIYIMPLTVSYYESMPSVFNIVMGIIIVGFLYLIFNTYRLVLLTSKGKMSRNSSYEYKRFFSNKFSYLGFSIPVIVGVSRGGRRFAIEMNRAGNRTTPLIALALLGLILQIIFFTMISELIVILYCKCRFESFNDSYELHSATGKKRKKMIKQARDKN